MLAPTTEVHYGEEALLRLTRAAAAAYPAFVAELEASTGRRVGYRPCGTLSVAMDAGDRAALADLAGYQQRLGLPVEPIGARDARRLEPALAPAVRGGMWAAEDHQVDSRRLVDALLAAASDAGARLVQQRVVALSTAGERVTGLRLADAAGGPAAVAAGVTLLAMGAHSGRLPGLPEGSVPVRPVKGQLLRLSAPADAPLIRHTVRALVAGRPVYLVPRASGELVVGATVEEMGFDTTVRAGAVADLLEDAQAVLPGVRELELAETNAGLRPGSPDNAPLIGRAPVDGLLLATGHYRNGVLLAGMTAAAIAELVTTGSLPGFAQGFSGERFGGPAGGALADDGCRSASPATDAPVGRPA